MVKRAKQPVLRIARYVANTLSEGPYQRFALWVQGCSLGCPDCCNPQMHDHKGGRQIRVKSLLDLILRTPDIEGVTFLGGEPFEQALPLALLAGGIHQAGLGVMTFSGHTLKALLGQGEAAQSLLRATDVLVAGPYVREKHTGHIRWVGSSNQKIHYLTPRYQDCPEFNRPGQSIHLNFSDDTMTITGFPDLFPELLTHHKKND